MIPLPKIHNQSATRPAAALRSDEFPPGASEWPNDLSRRRFLVIMSASLGLAGMAGCGRPPREKILPYVTAPESVVPGKPLFFATAMPWEGYARGILVESHLGRPTKVEGNPDHPASLGATDAITQASVLSLYDPDRSRVPLRAGMPQTWEAFERAWLERRLQILDTQGAGVAILAEPTASPTLRRLLGAFLESHPGARWFQHTALPRYDRGGVQEILDLEAADVILTIGGDPLFQHPAALRHARDFASRRRVAGSERPLSRVYSIESTPSLTGSMADHRLACGPARLLDILDTLATLLGATETSSLTPAGLDQAAQLFLARLRADLQQHAPNVLVLAGEEQDEAIHRWAAIMNQNLGATGHTVRTMPAVRSDADERTSGGLAELAHELEARRIDSLFILGGNPVYTAPADVALAPLIERTPFSTHLGMHVDETAAHCLWHLPESHFLETWGDLRAYDGTASIIQPLIEPLYGTRSAHALLDFLVHPPGMSEYEVVRETWRQARTQDFDTQWDAWLKAGVVGASESELLQTLSTPVDFATVLRDSHAPATAVAHALFRPDPSVADGRHANNAWLQELPRPFTNLVWDNAALVSPALAREHELNTGDIVRLEAGDRAIEVPVWVQPGQADDCVSLNLGYGRKRAGTVGSAVGVNVFALRTTDHLWTVPLIALRKTGRHHELVSTQEHFTMEGRDLARSVELGAIDSLGHEEPHASLFPVWESKVHAWAMVIDLGTCIGCNACVIACQAENNIPVVGREQVARGREMHWIRIDRYYSGEAGNLHIIHQPVLCMHCENAPCELVCPVAATVHSSEGLNDMVYNRCIGTRYCSNNCPYKVRRFNFLDYQPPADSMVMLQKNPDVTVRARGVMEKCTYCVQRINHARIEASKERRRIREGEIQTACQQACPTQAIVFGDLAREDARVVTLRNHRLDYGMLEELNTKPRTTYLARVTNPAAAPAPAEQEGLA
ncbi:MAG: 4Fe-4S dicluster domain-containing protein [Opitutaceae bacterium]